MGEALKRRAAQTPITCAQPARTPISTVACHRTASVQVGPFPRGDGERSGRAFWASVFKE